MVGTGLEYADCLESDEALIFVEWFRTNAPDAENYARLGFVVGHEITHAFAH